MTRALVVDDSNISAALIADVLSRDPQIEVIGRARNGREAIEMNDDLRPDVITMDVHMPEMNGFEATKEIMIQRPTPIVIVSASTAAKDAEWAMRALKAGALTILLKPPGPKSPLFEKMARELVENVKSMADVKVVGHQRPKTVQRKTIVDMPTPVSPSVSFSAIAIAASTGGPPALQTLLSGLPAQMPLPIFVVQHMAGGFLEGFTEWLDQNISLEVRLAEDGERPGPGRVYVAPEEKHLGLKAGKIVLSDELAIHGFRPSATHLFDSVGRTYGRKSLGVILTGMGRDGVEGLRTLRKNGGTTVAQDKKTSVVFGMPGAAVAEGLADDVIPIDSIADHILGLLVK